MSIKRSRLLMSKFNNLWVWISKNGEERFKLMFKQIENIAGIPIDHSFLTYKKELDLHSALDRLKNEFDCDRLIVQSGGTVNSLFLREKLFDFIDIVVAPTLIGGKDTPTLIDGFSLQSVTELNKISALKLIECATLQDSYLRLRYQVIK